ncbi:MAG: sugar transferase [Chitinispirillaceae bacterium]
MENGKIPGFFRNINKAGTEALRKEKDTLEQLMAETYGFYRQKDFRSMIVRERKRTERSGKPFVLMLLDLTAALEHLEGSKEHISDRIAIHKMVETLSEVTRDIDVRGWYEQGRTVGIIFTETPAQNRDVVLGKVRGYVSDVLGDERMNRVSFSLYCFPRDQDLGDAGKAQENLEQMVKFYPETDNSSLSVRVSLFLKRTVDILGTIGCFILFLPVFLIVPLLIKLDSRGPVFFRQERIGLNGRKFILYKFRSMRIDGDDSIHREYVRKLIQEGGDSESQKEEVYKITDDPRVTPVGRFLRRTSLDEIPQFINVLLGNMSLVGPRPAIPYEIEDYHIWHRLRLLETKPGITGIWQVEGRSRTNFDTMVRMDLMYGRTRNVLLDLKLIFRTPLALVNAKGAY